MKPKNARDLVFRLTETDKRTVLQILTGRDVSGLPTAWCGVALIEILTGIEIKDLSIMRHLTANGD